MFYEEYTMAISRFNTKVQIFPRRFSTFLTFWCKIRCNRNEASLYPCPAVAVSTPGLLDVSVSMTKLLDVSVSMPDRLYSDGTISIIHVWAYGVWELTHLPDGFIDPAPRWQLCWEDYERNIYEQSSKGISSTSRALEHWLNQDP